MLGQQALRLRRLDLGTPYLEEDQGDELRENLAKQLEQLQLLVDSAPTLEVLNISGWTLALPGSDAWIGRVLCCTSLLELDLAGTDLDCDIGRRVLAEVARSGQAHRTSALRRLSLAGVGLAGSEGGKVCIQLLAVVGGVQDLDLSQNRGVDADFLSAFAQGLSQSADIADRLESLNVQDCGLVGRPAGHALAAGLESMQNLRSLRVTFSHALPALQSLHRGSNCLLHKSLRHLHMSFGLGPDQICWERLAERPLINEHSIFGIRFRRKFSPLVLYRELADEVVSLSQGLPHLQTLEVDLSHAAFTDTLRDCLVDSLATMPRGLRLPQSITLSQMVGRWHHTCFFKERDCI